MAEKLTEMQAAFVRNVTNGMRQKEAAEVAGYSHASVEAYRLMQLPKVRDALHARREADIHGDLSAYALQTLRDLMGPKTPAATRYKAATWVLGQAGHASAQQDNNDKPLEDMTPEELAGAVQSGMAALQDIAGQLEGHHIVEGAPRRIRDITPPAEQADSAPDLSFMD